MKSYQVHGNELSKNVKTMQDEVKLLRDLAAIVVELSREERMKAIKQRWRDVNALRKPDRPPVWCLPVGCRTEILPDAELVCKDPFNRAMELKLKTILLKRDIGDDTPINDFYDVVQTYKVTPANTYGVDIRRESLDEAGTAWHYLAAIETPEDYDKLVAPQYELDRDATERDLHRANLILDGVMTTRSTFFDLWFAPATTVGTDAAFLRSMDGLMMDLIMEPELTHRMCRIIQQGVMNFLDAIERANAILATNTEEPMFMSDPLRPDNVGGPYTFMDCWVHGNSQEYDQVSPEMFKEFLLDYQIPIFERFGLSSYGCCENLTHKMDMVIENVKNLRLLICSAWTDMEKLIDRVDKKYCIMWRHKASDVVVPHDTTELKKLIFHQADILKGQYYQAVLRELQTLMGHNERLKEWTQITIDAVSR